jgi:hypothetical protein
MTREASGAQFEIMVDGVVRPRRDGRETAIEAARFRQQRQPGAKITVTVTDSVLIAGRATNHRRAPRPQRSPSAVRQRRWKSSPPPLGHAHREQEHPEKSPATVGVPRGRRLHAPAKLAGWKVRGHSAG